MEYILYSETKIILFTRFLKKNFFVATTVDKSNIFARNFFIYTVVKSFAFTGNNSCFFHHVETLTLVQNDDFNLRLKKIKQNFKI